MIFCNHILGKHLYNGVIQEKDILQCNNGMVTFKYIRSKTKKYQTRTVTGEHFLWLLMRHVLPIGFSKARCYGFLHSCNRKVIKLLQLILRFDPRTMFKKLKPRAKITCKCCGAKMSIIRTMIAATRGQQTVQIVVRYALTI